MLYNLNMTDGATPEQRPGGVKQPSKREILQTGWDALKQRVVKPLRDSLGLGTPYPTYKQLSRREFLKESAVVAGTAAAVGAGIYAANRAYKQSPEGRAQDDAYPKPEGLPDDILSKEELAKVGITVYQTPDVQLYIRRGALEIPVFKDAANKRINGLVISLVDHDRLSWNVVNKLPDEARKAWQDFHPHPKQYAESYWGKLAEYYKNKRDWYGSRRELTSKILELEEGLANINLRQIELLVGAGADLEEAMRIKRERVELAAKLRSLRLQQIEWESRKEQELSELLNAATEPRDKAIEYFAENGIDDNHVTGHILTPKNKSSRMKTFIYVSVGKGRKPTPDQSLPNPGWFVLDGENGPIYTGENNPGFTLRHELGHYEGKRQESDNKQEGEDEANKLAYEGIAEAWRKYQETGDTEGYPFVFVTKEGITITKNITKQPPTV